MLVAVVVVLYIVGTSSSKHKNPQPTSAHAGVRQHKHHPRTHTSTTPAPPKPRNVTLALVPTAPVYVCLENGARKVLISGVTYNVGQTIPTETAKEFFLTLGNASVQMKINGKPSTFPTSTSAIGLRIVPQGAYALPPGRGPTCT